MAKSLATKYRPSAFSDVCSQESIIQILERQLELNQLQHAYLFCGASGCGKTTIARIFANAINEGHGSPIEIDAASNSGVENARNIINSAYERSISGKYKIFIIDECHALSDSAWQAFLKCIEEPPEYTIFIFCTTDPQKIPHTIINRVFRFNFARVATEKIKDRLEYICSNEGFTNYTEACDYIARISSGGMRDAITTLDKCSNYSTDLDIKNVLYVLGDTSLDIMFILVNAIIDGNEAIALKTINDVYQSGADLKLFINQFLSFCLDIAKYIIFNDISVTSIPVIMEEKIKGSSNFDNAVKYYSYLINRVNTCKNEIKTDTNYKATIEVYILNMCRCL